jgi:hypothetical protein
MLRIHVPVKTLHALPILVEDENGGIIVVLVQPIFDASYFGPCRGDHLKKFRFDLLDGVGLDGQLGDYGNLGHGFSLFS